MKVEYRRYVLIKIHLGISISWVFYGEDRSILINSDAVFIIKLV